MSDSPRARLKLVVVGHRGSGRDPVTENTVGSMRAAVDHGADWVETDVHVDGEGRLVLQHDARMPDGTPVSSADTTGQRDTLEDLMGVMDDRVGVFIEVKTDCTQAHPRLVVDAVLARVRGARRPLLIGSFDPTIALHLRDVAPHLRRGLIVRHGAPLSESVRVAVFLGCHALVAHAGQVLEDSAGGLDPFVTAELSASGMALWAWDVTAETAGTLAGLGVSGLVTDDVVGVRRTLKLWSDGGPTL